MEKFDAIVIGSGPGGYVCAIKLAQLGIKVACVEGNSALGGTCLNVGCIPSKALLNASHNYHNAIENFSKMGIEVDPPVVNWNKMLSYKESMIADNTKGIEYLFKKNKITLIKGWASFMDTNTIRVDNKSYRAEYFVIATGSQSTNLNDIEFDEKVILSSTGALELKEIPKKMIIVGAGVIGLEMGSIYSRLGTEVTVLEYFDKVLNGMDHDISKNFKAILQKQGFKFHLNCSVSMIVKEKKGVKVTFQKRESDEINDLSADVVLVATGRKPLTKGLNLENIGVEPNPKGQIETDSNWRTTEKNIFAIGDVTAGPMLAHKAEEEGIAVAEIIAVGGPVLLSKGSVSNKGITNVTGKNAAPLSLKLQSISINMPRLAFESNKDETYFRARLALLMKPALSSMALRKKDISDLTRRGLNPILAKNTQAHNKIVLLSIQGKQKQNTK